VELRNHYTTITGILSSCSSLPAVRLPYLLSVHRVPFILWQNLVFFAYPENELRVGEASRYEHNVQKYDDTKRQTPLLRMLRSKPWLPRPHCRKLGSDANVDLLILCYCTRWWNKKWAYQFVLLCNRCLWLISVARNKSTQIYNFVTFQRALVITTVGNCLADTVIRR
jgi:hypothetical protein